MTRTMLTRRLLSSLTATALVLGSAVAFGQAPPPDQPAPPPDQPAPPEVAPPPPPPKTAMEGEPVMRGKNGELMLSKDAWVRVGLQAQVWLDILQAGAGTAMAATDGSYGTNFFLRRGRLITSAGF